MISIVIPTYNRAHLISRAITSVVNQTFHDWELVIADDGSKDNTREVVEPFLRDARIKYLTKANTGAAHTRNFGVQHSSGEWVTFLDSDDEAVPQWLQKFNDAILQGAKIISCGLEKYDETGKRVEVIFPRQNKTGTGGQFTNGGVYMIQRQLFDAVGGFDDQLRSGQHTELHFRIKEYALQEGMKSTIINEPLIKVHIHTGYRIRSDSNAKFEGSMYTYKKHYHSALASKKMRSLYESIIAYNAFKINKYGTALEYGWKSFVNKPSGTGLKRLVRYLFRIK